MKKRHLTLTVILSLIMVFCIAALLGCSFLEELGIGNNSDENKGVDRIQVEDTHIYLAPQGEASTYQLKPMVHPIQTASQKVYYRLTDNRDSEYLSVDTSGVVKAKKEKVDENGNNVDIIIRVVSDQDPSVDLEVTVTIETVAVEKITFNPPTMNITISGGSVKLNPIFTPYHASVGRNVIYTSNNEAIATVNSEGVVTPVSIGQCSIWVRTPKQGAFDDTQEMTLVTINVVYEPLQTGYSLDLTSGEASLKQVTTEREEISFSLTQTNLLTDPNPEIVWFVNNTKIDKVGVKNSKSLEYILEMPAGEYVIRAEVSNVFDRATFVSETIKIYKPITSFNADILNKDQGFNVGDSLQIVISHSSEVYPPESYRWYISKPDGTNTWLDLPPAEDGTGGIIIADLVYQLEQAGTYTIQAEAYVNGSLCGIKSVKHTVEVGAATLGNDIVDVHFDGAVIDGIVYSQVAWKALPYNSTYEVEIKTEKGTYSLNSATGSGGYFGTNYVRIPTEIATLSDSYEIRIKGSRYGWTEWYSYNGDISRAAYDYFDEIIPGIGINRYIANLEEYGELLNFITVFRPNVLLAENKTEDELQRYDLNLYVPFAVEDLDILRYPINDGKNTTETEASNIDAYRIFATAITTYVESLTVGIDVRSAELRGAVRIAMGIKSSAEPSVKTELIPGVDDEYIYPEAPFVNDYSTFPRGDSAALPIDSLTNSLEVRTSNELYLAILMGFKPNPVKGSKADVIYTEARRVLNSIIATGDSPTQKALAIYEWLSLNVTYDHKLAETAHTLGAGEASARNSFYLEGVFIDRYAVCDGIAKAYSMMCSMEGIANYKVVGKAGSVGHAWNMVLLDSKWYGVDATWASAKTDVGGGNTMEFLSKQYFAMSSELIDDTRTTFGVFPEISEEGLNYAYEVKVSAEFDGYIESDSELKYYVTTYMNGYLTGETDSIWAELLLEEQYLASKGGIGGINAYVNSEKPDGVTVAVYNFGNNRICINMQKIEE